MSKIRIIPYAKNFNSNYDYDDDEVPDLVPSNNSINVFMDIHKIIRTNYEKIIELLDNDNYHDINLMLYNDTTYEWRIFYPLSSYCFKHDDQPLLIKLFSKEKYHERNYIYIQDILKYDYLKKLLNILDNVETSKYTFVFFQYDIDNNIDMLKLLLEHNHTITDSYIYDIIETNNITIITYLFENDYGGQIQNVIDNSAGIYTNMETLKLLINYNINFTKVLDDMYIVMIDNKQLESIKFLMLVCPCADINYFLIFCGHNLNAMKYFVSMGADINLIEHDDIVMFNMDVIKFVISCGYHTDEKLMNNILKNKIPYENIDNTIYLLDFGADINCIFEIENIIQNLVMDASIDLIKYLMCNHYEIMQLHINKMVIIACANGKNDVLKYLYAFGIDMDNILIIISCYFGHLETLEILLGWGMQLDNIDVNLFLVLKDGLFHMGDTYETMIHKYIEGQYRTFNYGWQHHKIVDLLIEYKVPIYDFQTIFCYYRKLFYNEKFIKYCLGLGMDIDKFGLLGKCVANKNYNLVKLLLDVGADGQLLCKYSDFINLNDILKGLFRDYGYEF